MAITRYQSNPLLREFYNDINKLFDRDGERQWRDESNVETSQWLPAVDVKEEADRFVLFADVPGVDPKSIELHMEKGMLSIRGERASEEHSNENGFTRIERSRGAFYRRFSLPDSADLDNISASGKHGVLTVVIPKKDNQSSRKIHVSEEK